ncbi:DNA recombination protein RmuC [Burkholderia pseudomallei]|uniref:DNA recombination protein RmuC n=1 Tax=Burkholderia pseudomallei TaxID=28450 RepID=UPI00053739A8|nr:DNA recombination protein RmuC [Burkholderia pseudomallei]KGX53057.1 rmuC family protein [Burkholderia pseudomallei TSV5]KGX64946.1 rmuC family protein [Burkholderia pseudomallei TSV32]MDA0562560.1 DNA recombination protein RmuC [Burkholderia pseudomallei]CAJ3838603.1 DNA recombination protein rmuC [Burkholderia pseudomallei]CAJ3861680.1 DNA recombination protein rmuC [Burkholderia pseudomallei]
MDLFAGSAILILGLVVGAVIAWLLARNREGVRVQAAAAQAQSASQVQAAQLEERLRGMAEDLRIARDTREQLERQSNALRDELANVRDELARLSERSSRVPALEAEILKFGEQVRSGADELRLISTSEAQKQQLVASLTERVNQFESDNRELAHKLTLTSTSLQEAHERKAALEGQVSRIPELERKIAETGELLSSSNGQLTELRESSGRQNGKLSAELEAEKQAAALVRGELVDAKSARAAAESEVTRLTDELTEIRTRTEAERQNAEEKLNLLLQAKEALSNQFKTLATEILEEKSKRFAEQNQTSLGLLLEPLKTRLTEFQGKVEEVYVQEGKDRSALSAQVRQLVELNQALSQDAKNLTLALKGSTKTQGNWGELILERVLEASGLRKGDEYHVQDNRVREDGSRAQPDVVINLPEERKLVVDSKVSLLAYERYASAETDEERLIALRQHIDSIRNHIKSLSDKQYQALYGKSLDFVLAFVPIEPAFMLAVTNDNELFMDAWRRNVLLVSPSTLLFVVRTVAHLWRQEAQSRNAQDIARRGAELYDKLCGFVEDLQLVGNRLGQARKAYDSAHSKLAIGRGNVIRQAEMLRDMGVKPSKALPRSLVDIASSEDDAILIPSASVEMSVSQELGLPSGTSLSSDEADISTGD